MKRFPWESLLALVAGIAVGLTYAWVIAPVQYIDTSPNTLRSDFKDYFRTVIAASYTATHNLDRARARLALLGDSDPVEALTAQAQRMLASGASYQVVQDVADLASDLRAGVAAAPAGSPTSAPVPTSSPVSAPTSTETAFATASEVGTTESTATEPAPTTPPLNTPTPRPTATAIPTASAPFELVSHDEICNPNLTSGLMQVSVLDSHHHQMPGVEIDISWPGGDESFFTGLKPEIAAGYADYLMQPGVAYSLRVAHAGSLVADLAAPSCPDSSGGTFLGGLKLVFQQP
jgi:hypothetical protein